MTGAGFVIALGRALSFEAEVCLFTTIFRLGALAVAAFLTVLTGAAFLTAPAILTGLTGLAGFTGFVLTTFLAVVLTRFDDDAEDGDVLIPETGRTFDPPAGAVTLTPVFALVFVVLESDSLIYVSFQKRTKLFGHFPLNVPKWLVL